MSDRARQAAEAIERDLFNGTDYAGPYVLRVAEIIDRVIDAEVAERVGALQAVYDAALAWERAEQHAVEWDRNREFGDEGIPMEELGRRQRDAWNMKKELRRLARAALATAGAPDVDARGQVGSARAEAGGASLSRGDHRFLSQPAPENDKEGAPGSQEDGR